MKLYLRERFIFDPSIGCDSWKYLQGFWASADGRTFYVTAGSCGSVKFLAHRDEDGMIPTWYTSGWLHSTTLVRVRGMEEELSLLRALQRAADCADHTGTLIDMGKVPGFSQEDQDSASYHSQGWYSRGRCAAELSRPQWCDDPKARVFDIREGIYCAFSDGSIRLMRRREYYAIESSLSPATRQGDCLVFDSAVSYADRDYNDYLASIPVATGATLDRHEVISDDGQLFLRHPEHGVVEVRDGQHIMLLPGSSRPFSRDGGAD
jgi:hypothetical protein